MPEVTAGRMGGSWRPSALFIVAVLVVGIAGSTSARSEDAPAVPQATAARAEVPRDQLVTELETYKELYDKSQKTLEDYKAASAMVDLSLQKDYLEYKRKKLQFENNAIDINIEAFRIQQFSSRVMLALVVVIVLSALWFAYIQLKAGLVGYAEAVKLLSRNEQAAAGAAPGAAPIGNGEQSKIEIGLDRFSATTSIVGVMILMISLAFVYLYLEKAYKITYVEVSGAKTTVLQTGNGTKGAEDPKNRPPAPPPGK